MMDRYPTPPKNLMAFTRTVSRPTNTATSTSLSCVTPMYVCPKCGSAKAWSVAEKPGMMICDRGHKISVTAGTAMHRTKLPLHVWFYAVWLLATLKPGILSSPVAAPTRHQPLGDGLDVVAQAYAQLAACRT